MSAPAGRDPLFELPDHFVKDRALWRRKVLRRRDLTPGARLYAGYLAFHRAGRGMVAWERARAARAIGVSIRTVQRWTRELLDAGLLRRVVSAMPGRRQVFRLESPQVGKGDTGVSPRGERPPETGPRGPFGSIPSGPLHLNPTPGRTTAGRSPATPAAAAPG